MTPRCLPKQLPAPFPSLRALHLLGLVGVIAAAATAPCPAEFVQEAYLKSSLNFNGQWFGKSVAISGDTAVVGCWYSPIGGFNAGVAYVYVHEGGQWQQQAILQASNREYCTNFGGAVAISGDTIVVGAHREGSGATGVNGDGLNSRAQSSGAAYVFVRHAGVWTQQAYLKASNTGIADAFGSEVAIHDDLIIVGAPGEASAAVGVNGDQTNNQSPGAGAAYLFERTGEQWAQTAYLKAFTPAAAAGFGGGLSAAAGVVAVGVPSESSGGAGVNPEPTGTQLASSGAVYVYQRGAAGWLPQAFIKSPEPAANAYFGNAVALSANRLAIGASNESVVLPSPTGDLTHASAGVVRSYRDDGGAWIFDAKLSSPNPGPNHRFGTSVGLSGELLVAGAWGEAGDGSGVNGSWEDQRSVAAGGAYVFRGASGSPWALAAYLKASNNGPGDRFGCAAGISGERVIVASWYEDSGAQYVNGYQDDEYSPESGAAYVFGVPEPSADPAMRVAPTVSGSLSHGAVLSLGVTPVGSPVDCSLMISNPGTTTLTGLAGALNLNPSGDFSILRQPAVQLAPGGSTECVIRCLPRATGVRSAGVTFSNANGTPRTLAVTLRVNLLNSMESWRQTHFGNPARTAANHEQADPDGDGMANLLEFAFNLDPNRADHQLLEAGSGLRGLPRVTLVDEPYRHLQVEFIRRKPAANPGFFYRAQVSTSPGGGWQSLSGALGITAIDTTWERVVQKSGNLGPAGFARVLLDPQ
jgi:hypothetical protein